DRPAACRAAGRRSARLSMGQVRGRAFGIALVIAATVLWSTAGLFVRLLDADGPIDVWAMLAWRSLFAAASLFLFIALQHRTRPADGAGNALAFLMTLSFGVVLVMARRYPSLGMAPINALGAALCGILCWPLMATGLPSLYQLVVLALFGATNTAFAYLLFLIGGRYIPSGEAGLIAMLDVVLGPLWVWLVFAEQPGGAAIIGGGLVLASVLWYLAAQLRDPISAGSATS